jgi:hypothetical protein
VAVAPRGPRPGRGPDRGIQAARADRLDTGLIPAVGVTPANVPEASVTGDITADLDAAGLTLAELHIDRAYLSSSPVRDRGPDLAIFCKAWRVRNTGGRYAKGEFTIDSGAGQMTCPAGVSTGFRPERLCTSRSAPARPARCGNAALAAATGAASPPPDESLHAELRQRQQTRPDARSSANASRSNTSWPTSATGRAVAPATAAPARTCSTSGVSLWSTTSTSSHASLPSTAISLLPDYMTGALAVGRSDRPKIELDSMADAFRVPPLAR